MIVGIVGLGLIGGSMAKSIKNRTSHTVWGIDLNAETMTMARMCGAIDAPLTEENLPEGLTMLPLPGHFFDMCGFGTADGVWFLADCLTSEAVIEKYHVQFLYDVAGYLDTLDKVSRLEGRLFIPAHAEATEDIRPLAEKNRQKVLEIIDVVRSLCREPKMFEDILQGLFAHYQLTMDFSQYVLVGSTLRSYLAYLLDNGGAEAEFIDNRLLWRAV